MRKFTFYTEANCLSQPTVSGEPIAPRYGETVDDNGNIVIEQCGIVPTWELTQACKPKDIYAILKQTGYDVNSVQGFTDLLADMDESIQDFTQVPRTLADAYRLIKKAEDSYMSLTPEIRAEFTSGADLLNAIQDGSIKQRVARFMPQPQEVVKDVDNK